MMVISGELDELLTIFVGVGSLATPCCDSPIWRAMSEPLASSRTVECHSWWCALKSPVTMSISCTSRCSMFVWYPGGQDEEGGM